MSKKNIPTIQFQLDTSPKVEAIGISVNLKNNEKIDIISVYCPKGNCNAADLIPIFSYYKNKTIIAGDFNAHHSQWETRSNSNQSGYALIDMLTDTNDILLLTPRNLNTRIDPRDGKESTIDLTFTSTNFALNYEIKTGPYWGSDHLPIIFTTKTKSPAERSRNKIRW